MRINLVQMAVNKSLAINKDKILNALKIAQPEEVFAFPEGALTGYFPAEDDYLKDIGCKDVENAIHEIKAVVDQRNCHCLLGTALFYSGFWRNAVLVMSQGLPNQQYLKIKVGSPEDKYFKAGGIEQSPVFIINGIKIGINICRESVFPEIWSHLKKLGAEVVFHINNAIKPKDQVWKHIFITRAIENDYFVCSVNNANPPQELPSCIVAPSGKIIAEGQTQKETLISYDIKLADKELRINF
jgi:predicted amidohydrolase